jgi:hypothetical protein
MRPSTVIARVQRQLSPSAELCFAAFCDVERIPQWVERVVEASVRTTHPDGRPAEVEFVARRPDGDQARYTLAYAYDRKGLRVSWRPREGEGDAVMGYASFDPADGGTCLMTYALQEGYAWDQENRDLQQVATELADTFAEFVGK